MSIGSKELKKELEKTQKEQNWFTLFNGHIIDLVCHIIDNISYFDL